MARAGRHRHYITVQRVADGATDSAGGVVEDWQDYSQCWADQMPTGGTEFTAAAQVHAELTHLLVVRYDPDKRIHPKDRIVWDGAVAPLDILAAPVEHAPNRNLVQKLTCRELVDGG
jgi:SPP1 family predicted phage head-tail adaptor